MVNKMSKTSGDRLVSVRDTAQMLGCSVATVWRKTTEEDFPQPVKIGGMTRWSTTEIHNYIENAKASREVA